MTEPVIPVGIDAASRVVWPQLNQQELIQRRAAALLENNSIRERLLQWFTAKYKNDKRIVRARTFWSTAWWNFTEFSDVDLLVIVRQDQVEGFKNEILGFLEKDPDFLWFWQYETNHFYVVFRNLIPLDLYIVGEEESKTILQAWNKKAAIFHILGLSNGIQDIISPQENDSIHEKWWSRNSEALESTHVDPKIELLERAFTRAYRLLSKLEKWEFMEFVFIMNSIREDNLVPLLEVIWMNFPNIKKVKIPDLPDDLRDPFINSFSRPTWPDCHLSLINLMLILRRILDQLTQNMNSPDTSGINIAHIQRVNQWFSIAFGRIYDHKL